MTETEDPCDYLREQMERVQRMRIDNVRPAEELLDEAVALVRLAREPRFAACPVRICAFDQLIAIYCLIDDVAYAPEVFETASRLRAEVGRDSTCYACLSSTMADAERRRGNPKAALELSRSALADMELTGLSRIHYSARLLQELVWSACDAKDGRRAQTVLAKLEALRDRAESIAASTDHAFIRHVADNLVEHVHESKVLAALAAEDTALAIRRYVEELEPDEPSHARLRIQMALLEHLDASTAAQCGDITLDALDYAEASGFVRDLCETALLVLERGLEPASRCRAILEQIAPRLRSTDLQPRIDAIGG